MKGYFEVVINQYIDRGKRLLAEIENSEVPSEFHVLAQICRDAIIKEINNLTALRDNSQMQLLEAQEVRLRGFRRAIDQISNIETTGGVALSRRHPDDIFLNRLIQQIRQEIKYPLLPPTVTGLSTNYFYILNDIKLMFVPLSEGNYLLHLPDLYHEIAHPILYDTYHSKGEVLQKGVEQIFLFAGAYLDNETRFSQEVIGPESFAGYFYFWQRSWRKWAIEFFCDLFAVFTLGPAYAWSHIHLCMKSGDNPFFVPKWGSSTHPADDARMRVILMGLQRIGYDADVGPLERKWNEYLLISGARSDALYKRCFTNDILRKIVELAYQGTLAAGCRIATPSLDDPVHLALNDAWKQFWSCPADYTQWEREEIKNLRTILRL